MKNEYRITKYNPKFRNNIGHYLRDEWIDYSEIGKFFMDEEFTYEEYIKKEKFWMTERMRKLGLNVWGSEANYIFFKGKAGLYEKALKRGLLIRDCSNYEGLTEGHYRIAIRSEEENERLITWLEKL